MKRLQDDVIIKNALSAFREFIGEINIDDIIDFYHWGRSFDKCTCEFRLYDHSMYPEWGKPTGKIDIDDRPEKLKSKHILTIYVDRYSGKTFVRRLIPTMPWEKAA